MQPKHFRLTAHADIHELSLPSRLNSRAVEVRCYLDGGYTTDEILRLIAYTSKLENKRYFLHMNQQYYKIECKEENW